MSTNPDSDLDARWMEALAASGVSKSLQVIASANPVCCCSTFESNGVSYRSVDAGCRLHGLGADVNVRRWARKFVPDESVKG